MRHVSRLTSRSSLFRRTSLTVGCFSRRYGSLAQQDGQKYRYHEYYLISYDPVRGSYVEDRSVTLFHVMLPLSETRGFMPPKLSRRVRAGK
eukprot:COSAG02_NODE_95_length_37416_cov_60.512742_28_plen_91_part_00